MSVYFFTCRAANAVKIGNSVDPHGRLPEIQRGCPLPVVLEACLPGHHKEEFALHDRFADDRIQGGRLTPRECERLQGFPDDYTLIPLRKRNKKAEAEELRRFALGTYQDPDDFKWPADGPRYKALGNSMAVPVMRWLGERITLIDAIVTEARRAETVQLGSAHEGAGRQASPKTCPS